MIALKNSDIDLQHSIRNRIKWDKRVSTSDVDIVVKNGTVTINGFLDSSYKKHAALEIVGSTEGVWSIDDRMVVPDDYYRTDDELKKIIKAQVNSVLKLGGEHIEIDVVDGIVKFEGEVFRPRLKALASGVAWELSGVRDCLNFIEIVSPPNRAPQRTQSVDFENENLLSLSRA